MEAEEAPMDADRAPMEMVGRVDAPAPDGRPFDRVLIAPGTMQDPPTTAPDVLVIDLSRTDDSDPLRLCRETARRSPATAIVGVGPEDRLADGYQLLRLGGVGWSTGELYRAGDELIAAAQQGESLLARRHAAWVLADFAKLTDRATGHDPRFNPTATEREVLTRLAKGQSPDEIAALHDVDAHLVKRHVRLALNRLHRHW